MAFKFRIQKGLHVEQSLFDKLCTARNMRIHGEIMGIEAVHVAADSPEELQSRVRNAKIARITQTAIEVVPNGRAVDTERFPYGDFFLVTTEKGCMRVRAYGEEPAHVGLTNFLNKEIAEEDARREAWNEQAQKSSANPLQASKTEAKKGPTPRSERFAKHPAPKNVFARW